MSKTPESTRPDALRLALAQLRRRIDSAATAVPATTTVTGWTDAMPRSVIYTLNYTAFNTAASVVDALIASLPAGTVTSYVRIEPSVAFTGTGLIGATAEIPAPSSGAIASSGTYKYISVAAPLSTIGDQASAAVYATDNSGAADFYLRLSLSGCNGSDLTAGQIKVHMTVCVPGSTADTLPHA